MSRPGVYVSEAPLPRSVTTTTPTQSYGAFLGTATKGPTEPVLVNSWAEFVALFGGLSSGSTYTLPLALYQYFANGGPSCFICRVLPSDAAQAQATFSDGSPRIKFWTDAAGAWGNTIKYTIDIDANDTSRFTVSITETVRGADVTVERFSDLTMVRTDPRYFVNIINSGTIGSKIVSVEDIDKDDADLTTGTTEAEALAGGSDGVAADEDYALAFTQFDTISALLVVNAPNVRDAGLYTAVANRGNSFIVVDPEENDLPADVIADASLPSLGTTDGSYAAVYYPWLHIADPASDAPRGSTVKVPPGASVAGMILRTESSRGVYKAPAGIAANLVGTVATERRLTTSNLNDLSDAHINAIRPVPGAGISVMGARTRATSTSAKYISVRRLLNYVKQRSSEVSKFALFEPNSPNLWDQLRVTNGSFLSELWQMGGLAGVDPTQAYYVKVDRDINTEQTIANGEVHIELGVAPVYPAEFVIIRVGQFEADASIVVSEEG